MQAVAVQVRGLRSMQRILSRRDSMKKYISLIFLYGVILKTDSMIFVFLVVLVWFWVFFFLLETVKLTPTNLHWC